MRENDGVPATTSLDRRPWPNFASLEDRRERLLSEVSTAAAPAIPGSARFSGRSISTNGQLVLRPGPVMVYGADMRYKTAQVLQVLLALRARKARASAKYAGTAPVYGSFLLLCPVCRQRLVLRHGAHGLRYYCACPPKLRPRGGKREEHPAPRKLLSVSPPALV